MRMLDHALDYAARGMAVFPCNPSPHKPNSKRPLTANGFKDATTDPDTIRKWWTERPEALIGVPMGPDAGVFAIDPDVVKEPGDADGMAAWAALVAEHGEPPHTHTHETPTGGRHFLFRWRDDRPISNREGALQGTGINVRGKGGYVIAPPSSLTDGRAYRIAESFDSFNFAEAPAWLFDLIEAKPSREPQPLPEPLPVEETTRAGSHDRYVAAAVAAECRTVATTRSGGRNNALNLAAFNLGTLVGANVLDSRHATDRLLEAARASGLVGDDGQRTALATIESGMGRGAERPRVLPEPKTSKARHGGARAEAGDRGIGDNDRILLMEDAAALQFAAQFRDRLKYDHDAGGWFEWVGSHWRRNGTGLAFHWARELARNLARDEDDKTRVTVGKAAFAGNVERFARSDPTFAVRADGWDRDPFLLGTPDGVVDLRTGAMRPASPVDGITKLAAVSPAPNAFCPLWLRFLGESSGHDGEMVRFLQQYMGYALTGSTREHALAFVHGPGGNGKSVFCNIAAGILQDYAVTASMDVFIASQGDRHPTDLAMLRGARLVTASETEEGRQWAEARIKQMTGGDPITARFMRQDFFTFLPAFKLMIVGNHKPGLRNVDDAARRRFNLVPFTRKPDSPDRQLEEKLRAEWPAILRWMIDGCLDWQRNGLVRPASVVAATDDYFEGQDVFSAWLEDDCDVEPGNEWKTETSAILFTAWQVYAKNGGEFPGTRRRFADQMQRRGFELHKGAKGVRLYRGIRLIMEAKSAGQFGRSEAA